MIKLLLLAVVPFMTQHRNVVPKTEVSTNFYGSVTGIVDNAYIKSHGGGGGGCDTNAVDALANAAVVTNALTVATTNRVAALETATNNLSSSKADISALTAHTENTDNPHSVTAAQVGAYTKAETDARLAWKASVDDFGRLDPRVQQLGDALGTINLTTRALAGGDWYVDGDVYTSNGDMLSAKADRSMISATDPTFSNAVLSVGINTNLVASIGELNDFIHGYGELGATSVGGLILALLGAAALLRKKTKLLKSDGTAEDDFAVDLMGKPVAISAMRYGLVSTDETVKAADRTVTKVTLSTTAVTVTFPDADENGKTRDFLLRIDAANLATGGSLNITKPTGATIYGDAFPSPEATKQYLVAITETAANEFYVRTIEITISTEA